MNQSSAVIKGKSEYSGIRPNSSNPSISNLPLDVNDSNTQHLRSTKSSLNVSNRNLNSKFAVPNESAVSSQLRRGWQLTARYMPSLEDFMVDTEEIAPVTIDNSSETMQPNIGGITINGANLDRNWIVLPFQLIDDKLQLNLKQI